MGNTDDHPREGSVRTGAELAQAAGLDQEMAEQLIARARREGVNLVGEGGLLKGLVKLVLEGALEAEMAEHLGYERGQKPAERPDNARNGTSKKTVRTDVGEVELAVPRDRAGTFTPQVVPKHQRKVPGFDQAILSLYAKGLTTGEIQAHLSEIYDVEVSRDLISRATEQVGTESGALAQQAAGSDVRGLDDRRDPHQDP